MAKAEAHSRHFGEERAKQISRHLFDSRTGSSGRPLFSYDRTTALCLGESHPGGPTTSRGARSQLNHPGLCSLVERGRSRALPLLVWSERTHADRCAARKTAMDGPQARFTIERLSHVGKHEQHASVSVSGSGHISLPLSAHPFLPRWLHCIGVLVCAGLGTCVFRLISLLACLLCRAVPFM